MNDANFEITFRTHEAHFIPPNRVWVVMRGTCEEVDVAPYLNFISAHSDRIGEKLDVTVDVTALTRISSEARRKIIGAPRGLPYRALALVGTGFYTSTLVSMLMKAGKIVAPNEFTYPYTIVKTRAEADAWFDELRSSPKQ